jgi:hypothetical protein
MKPKIPKAVALGFVLEQQLLTLKRCFVAPQITYIRKRGKDKWPIWQQETQSSMIYSISGAI